MDDSAATTNTALGRATPALPPANALVAASGSFDALIARQSGKVTRLAYRLLGWRTDVEDVVQDVFLAAYRNRGRFRHESNVNTWLTRITINACRTHLRKQKLRLRLFPPERDTTEPVAAAAGSADDRAALDPESFATVRSAIQALSWKYRAVIVLRYLEAFSIAQIAELLHVAPNTVEVRLSRARVQLKAALGPLLGC